MTDELKPDMQRAQKMLRKAMVEMTRKCGLRFRPDMFIVVSLVAVSAVATELLAVEKLLDPAEVDKYIDFAKTEFGKFLREDLDARLEDERKKARH